MPSSLHCEAPPRTPVAFRVGVTGHRPNRLQEAEPARLTALIGEILQAVKSAVETFHQSPEHPVGYSAEAPVLRLASSLAEGADRIVAEQALGLGYSLCCPTPFALAEYENDFARGVALSPESVTEFRGLLERARCGAGLVTFELDGSRTDAATAYGNAGRVVLNQSDLLIVIWDGREPRGAGGTIQTMREAIDFQVPVIWIDAVAPHAWQLVCDERDLPPVGSDARYAPKSSLGDIRGELARVVNAALEWPPPEDIGVHGRVADDLRTTYFQEHRPRFNPAPFWKLFRGLAGEGKLRMPSLTVSPFEISAGEKQPSQLNSANDATPSADSAQTTAAWVKQRLGSHFTWSDRLADFYGDKYRSSFVLAYPLAALAVVVALFPITVEPLWHSPVMEVVCIITELLTVGAIIGLVFVGKARRWHDRWMAYRVLAEVVRQLQILIPLGGGRPFIQVPSHLQNYGEPARTWMFSFMRALGRATGLPSARIDNAYIVQYLQHLKTTVEEQHHFHHHNEQRAERIEHTLHRTAFGLLALTILAILLHLAPFLHLPGAHVLHEPEVSRWLTLVAAGFPALGSALAGISNQGEFSRVAKRSRAMAFRMNHLAGEIGELQNRVLAQNGSVRLDHVTPLALHFVQLMVDENLDWRVVFTDRPPTLPA